MLKIRLQRIGRVNEPTFRVVVTEHTRGPKSEKHVDRVGFYNPHTKEQKLDGDRIRNWIAKGAQVTGTVHNMLVKAGIIDGKTVNVLPQKSPVKKEEDDQAAADTTATASEGDAAPAADDAEGEAGESDGAAESEDGASEEEKQDEGESDEETPGEDASAQGEEDKKDA